MGNENIAATTVTKASIYNRFTGHQGVMIGAFIVIAIVLNSYSDPQTRKMIIIRRGTSMVTEIPAHEFVVPCCADALDMWESFEYSSLKRVSIVAGERIIIRCNTCTVAYNRLRRRRQRQRTKNATM